jgi:hypothetical protein
MKSKDGFVQAYNAQSAVDGEAQIIVAHDVTQSGVDRGQLVPMTDAIETNLGRKPEQLSADAGYCSEANLEALEKPQHRCVPGDRPGHGRRCRRGQRRGRRRARAGASQRTDARRGHAREDQGRRAREPLAVLVGKQLAGGIDGCNPARIAKLARPIDFFLL